MKKFSIILLSGMLLLGGALAADDGHPGPDHHDDHHVVHKKKHHKIHHDVHHDDHHDDHHDPK